MAASAIAASEDHLSRAARLLALIQALRRRRRPVSASDLATELQVSLRTIYRDVATLVGQGAPIEGEAGMGYILRPGFFLPPLMFSEDEIDALMLGLRLVTRRDDAALGRAAEDAMAKIAAVLPRERCFEATTSGLLAGPRAHGSPHLGLIRQAMRAEEKLALDYADRHGRPSRRTVWPVALGFFESAEILAAWCEMRQEFRHFRLDRIVAAEGLQTRYARRRRVLLAEWRSLHGIDAT